MITNLRHKFYQLWDIRVSEDATYLKYTKVGEPLAKEDVYNLGFYSDEWEIWGANNKSCTVLSGHDKITQSDSFCVYTQLPYTLFEKFQHSIRSGRFEALREVPLSVSIL